MLFPGARVRPRFREGPRQLTEDAMTTATFPFSPGLEGVVAARTAISHVDGQRGQLVIRGFALEDIAPRATFEEMVYLL
jgi:citrate synthase